jgi:hypothetical protein
MRTDPMLTALTKAMQRQQGRSRIGAGHELAQADVARHSLTAIGSLECWPRNAATLVAMARGSGARTSLQSTSPSGSAKKSWLGEPENGSVRHDASLHQWRSAGVEHAHDARSTLSCPHQLSSPAR